MAGVAAHDDFFLDKAVGLGKVVAGIDEPENEEEATDRAQDGRYYGGGFCAAGVVEGRDHHDALLAPMQGVVVV